MYLPLLHIDVMSVQNQELQLVRVYLVSISSILFSFYDCIEHYFILGTRTPNRSTVLVLPPCLAIEFSHLFGAQKCWLRATANYYISDTSLMHFETWDCFFFIWNMRHDGGSTQ